MNGNGLLSKQLNIQTDMDIFPIDRQGDSRKASDSHMLSAM